MTQPLIPLFYEPKVDDYLRDNCARLSAIAFDRGYDLTEEDAFMAWRHYTLQEKVFTSWATLPDSDEECWEIIRQYLTEGAA